MGDAEPRSGFAISCPSRCAARSATPKAATQVRGRYFLARKGPTEVLSACDAPHDTGKNGWNGIQGTDGRPERARTRTVDLYRVKPVVSKLIPFVCLAFPILTALKILQNVGFWSRIDDEFFGAKRSMDEPNPVVQALLAKAHTRLPTAPNVLSNH